MRGCIGRCEEFEVPYGLNPEPWTHLGAVQNVLCQQHGGNHVAIDDEGDELTASAGREQERW
jgi:hypothetical protein